jgi:hypothetical protein
MAKTIGVYGARRTQGARFYAVGPSFQMRQLFKRVILSLRERREHLVHKAGIWWGPHRELHAGTMYANAPQCLRRKH